MNAAWKVLHTARAQRDHADIIRWTAERFGPEQARVYQATIRLAFAALRTGPDAMGVRQRDDIAPGIFTLHVARNGRKGRHFIVFRVNGDERVMDVLRLLHDSMDLGQRLAD